MSYEALKQLKRFKKSNNNIKKEVLVIFFNYNKLENNHFYVKKHCAAHFYEYSSYNWQ